MTSSNFQIRISNGNQTVPITVTSTPLNLTHYKVAVDYAASVHKLRLTVVISLSSRRLLESRLLQTVNVPLEFDFTINTYPPANYYPTQTIDLFALFSTLIRALSISSLAVAVGCYIGKKRTVIYSIETANLIVLVYISQGFGLNSYIDWLGSSITSMKECNLIGGFTFSDCRCPAEDFHQTYGYGDQLTTNAGIMMTIYLVAIVLYAVWFAIMKCMKTTSKDSDGKETICYTRLKNWQYDFKYYLIATLLALSGNMLFSSLITLYAGSISSAPSAINLFLAVLVMVAYITFLVFFFSWTRRIKTDEIHPDSVLSK